MAVTLTLVKRLSTHLEYAVGHVIDVDDFAVGGIAKQATKPVRKQTCEMCRMCMGVSTGRPGVAHKFDWTQHASGQRTHLSEADIRSTL